MKGSLQTRNVMTQTRIYDSWKQHASIPTEKKTVKHKPRIIPPFPRAIQRSRQLLGTAERHPPLHMNQAQASSPQASREETDWTPPSSPRNSTGRSLFKCEPLMELSSLAESSQLHVLHFVHQVNNLSLIHI
eukprot:TRINITY_DN55632_c0_g1_i1.p1 TRINITY_DN55632_c0_g1~~TRINITY_DN55632_c0_g1_i1.p1  ORF type:complete len:132 (+),score=20.36 TRINITY_DN55632_c0_g1_i1:229-624(+)